MRRRGVKPSGYTFTFVVKSCTKMSRWRLGEKVHCFAIRTGFELNNFVATTLMGLYAGAENIGAAREMFDQMLERNIVAWTAIVAAYVSVGDIDQARWLFDRASERDAILWNTMIMGYLAHGNTLAAYELFAHMPECDRDIVSWNTILHGYANAGDAESCRRMFDKMPKRDVFSWNALIGGFLQQGLCADVLLVFNWMLLSSETLPNEATLVMVLSSCSRLGTLRQGRQIHAYSVLNGFKGSTYVGNGLVDVYSKCGCISDANNIFEGMNARDLITWNTMICGLAVHGHGKEALELFQQMKESGYIPDGITFIGVLCSCAHMGLLEDAFFHFKSMSEDYYSAPCIEHYGCIVDLLGRAGFLDEAVDFIRMMPMEPDGVIWGALLGACKSSDDVLLAELALSKIIKVETEDPGNYVVLSNVYSAAGKWEEVGKLKRLVKQMSVERLPGCSSINIGALAVEFCSSDTRYSRTSEIYGVLQCLLGSPWRVQEVDEHIKFSYLEWSYVNCA